MNSLFFESLHRSGIPALARALPARHVVVLNFHRVRDEPSAFDDHVVELGSRAFREHLEWIAKRADVLSEDGLLAAKLGGRPKVMLTFDDGYRDCHDVIAPVLERLGLPAIFFVAPGMIDHSCLGAWDRIAYLLKNTEKRTFRLRGRDFSLENGVRPAALAIARWSQESLPDQGDSFVRELAATLGMPEPSHALQAAELLTWHQVRDLRRRGFAVGCHGYSHRVLSSLPLDEQEEEILLARARLTAEGAQPRSFAYPFGEAETYSWETRELVVRAGFELVFSFAGHASRLRGFDPTRVDRVAFKSTPAKYDFLLAFPGAHNLAHRIRGGHES